MQIVAVGGDVDRACDVGNLGVECSQTVVVVDFQGIHTVQIDTTERAQESVTNGHTASLRDDGREGKRVQVGERFEVDGLCRCQVVELERRQQCHVGQ